MNESPALNPYVEVRILRPQPDFDCASPSGSARVLQLTPQGRVTPVTWVFAPEWLTVNEACILSGWDSAAMLEIIEEGGVDLNLDGLIEKRSLFEFQETLVEILNWND